MIILIDMDNTLVDFDGGLLHIWRKTYPDAPYVKLSDRRSFHPHKDYPPQFQDAVQAVCHSKGFIRGLPAIPGGVEAVLTMLDDGHDVRFCTSHLYEYTYCVVEKYEWIEQNFGASFVDRLILTRDKTLIRGDILIDDKPVITGIMTPTWRHTLYDQPYNQGGSQSRLTWQNWREVVYD